MEESKYDCEVGVLIDLKIRKDYNFEIVVEAELLDGKILYHACLHDASFISHFDPHEVFTGDSVEASLDLIAKGLDRAIGALRDEI